MCPRVTAGAACVVLVLAAGASAYQPLPWDSPSGDRARTTRTRGIDRRPAGPRGLFGTAGVSFDWSVRPGDGVSGLADGVGGTLEIPATLPAWAIYAMFDPTAVLVSLTEEAWMSGVRGEGLGTAPVFDEIAFVFLLSYSTHDDVEFGGNAICTRYGLGVKLTGPGPASNPLRATLSGGWAWGDFDFDMRGGLDGTGPYLGVGIEARGTSGQRGEAVMGLRADVRWEWLRGVDGSGGDFSTRTFTAGAGVAFYW
ncbi:MAG: hypothetical protein ACYTFI_24185 [Planctomycetota bacterium]